MYGVMGQVRGLQARSCLLALELGKATAFCSPSLPSDTFPFIDVSTCARVVVSRCQ